ncbi:MAG: SpaA isopeptide-forming pilin-related protein, partial [Oscillospiraceae bacterium]|nr:SpaA isopeptide-forming pilin-related protein [Oscillospiraceae bacterium]
MDNIYQSIIQAGKWDRKRKKIALAVFVPICVIALILTSVFVILPALTAGADVTGKTSHTLTVKISGQTVYTGTGSTGSVTTTTLRPGSVLSFILDWTVTDKLYLFQDGDQFIFNILSIGNSALLSILPPAESIPLRIEGVLVGEGTFKWSGGTLQYIVTFNSMAKNVLVRGGNATGAAQFKLSGGEGTIPITFEDSYTGNFDTDPEPEEPYDPGGVTGIPGGSFPYIPPERDEPDIFKALVNDDEWQSLLWDDSKVEVYTELNCPYPEAHYPNTNLFHDGDCYTKDYCHGLTFVVPFYGLQELFEKNPSRKPTDYVIVEDTLSANMRFAGFWREGGATNSMFTEGKYDNRLPSFFGVEVGLRAFDVADAYSGHTAGNGAFGDAKLDFIPDINGNTGPVTDYFHGVKTLQKDFTELNDEAAVRETPLSYAVIDLPDGRQKLIVNLGKFGMNVPPGEGLKANNIYKGGDTGNETAGTCAIKLLDRFLGFQQNPYDYIMDAIDTWEQHIIKLNEKDPPFDGYWGLTYTQQMQDQLALFKADLQKWLQYGDPSRGFPDTYRQETIDEYERLEQQWPEDNPTWPPEDFPDHYRNYFIRNNIFKPATFGDGQPFSDEYIEFLHYLAYEKNPIDKANPSYGYNVGLYIPCLGAIYDDNYFTHRYPNLQSLLWALEHASGDNLRAQTLAVNLASMVSGDYKDRFDTYREGGWNWIADGYLKGLLFHFPNMINYFDDVLDLGLTGTESFEQVMNRIKTTLGRGGGYAAIRADYCKGNTFYLLCDTYDTPIERADWPHDIIGYKNGDLSNNLLAQYLPIDTSALAPDGASIGSTYRPKPSNPAETNIMSIFGPYDYMDPLDQLSISNVRLWYRTVLIDESEDEFTNDVKITTNDYTKTVNKRWRHFYNATIWGRLPNQLGFIKADNYANQRTVEWEYDVTPNNFVKIVQGVAGAKFEVYYKDGNILLPFIKVSETGGIPIYKRVVEEDPDFHQAVTQLTTGKNGTFKLTVLPDDDIYLKEVSIGRYYPSGTLSGDINPFMLGDNVAMFDIPSGAALRKFAAGGTTPLNDAVFNIYKDDGGGNWSLMPGGFIKRQIAATTTAPPNRPMLNAYWYDPNGSDQDLVTDYRYAVYSAVNPSLVVSALDADKGFIYVFGLPAGNYKFVETKAPFGYQLQDPPPEAEFSVSLTGTPPPTLEEAMAQTGTNHVTVQNVDNENVTAPKVKLLKAGVPSDNVAAAGTPMSGVGFKLLKTTGNLGTTTEYKTDPEGVVLWDSAYFGSDFAGIYMLVETYCPSSVTPIDPIMFEIGADGKVRNIQIESKDAPFVSFNNLTGEIEFKVKNAVDPQKALLQVVKTVVTADGGPVAGGSGWYEFILKDSGGAPVDISVKAEFTPTSGGKFSTDGSDGKFQLKNNGLVTIDDLTDNGSYTVTEISTGNYTTTVKVNAGTATDAVFGTVTAKAGEVKTVEFINKLPPVIIEGDKEVTGNGTWPEVTFTFELKELNTSTLGDYKEEGIERTATVDDVTTAGTHHFAFDPIAGLADGTHWFEIKEVGIPGVGWK